MRTICSAVGVPQSSIRHSGPRVFGATPFWPPSAVSFYLYNLALRLGVPIKGGVSTRGSRSCPGKTGLLMASTGMPRSAWCSSEGQPPSLVLPGGSQSRSRVGLSQGASEVHGKRAPDLFASNAPSQRIRADDRDASQPASIIRH
jgi:hypothetical protein